MFFRSGVLAGLLGVLAAVGVSGWFILMGFWNIGSLWFVLPVPALLLLVTWLRTPDWLLERNRPRAWLRPAVVLLAGGMLIIAAVAWLRAYEIPAVDPGFSPSCFTEPPTPQGQATLDLYRRAWERYAPIARFITDKDEQGLYDDGPIPRPLCSPRKSLGWRPTR